MIELGGPKFQRIPNRISRDRLDSYFAWPSSCYFDSQAGHIISKSKITKSVILNEDLMTHLHEAAPSLLELLEGSMP